LISGVSFLGTLLVSRFSNAEGLGLYSLGFSIVVTVAAIQEALVTAPYTIYSPQLDGEGRRRYAGSQLVLHVALAAACLALLLTGALWMHLTGHIERLSALLTILAITVPISLMRELGRRFAWAHRQARQAVFLDAIAVTTQIVLLASLAFSDGLNALSGHVAFGAASALGVVAWWSANRRAFAIHPEQVRADVKRSWSLGSWVLAGGMVAVVHSFLLHWLLAIMLGVAATGALDACWTVILIANPLVIGIGNMLGPHAAHAVTEGGFRKVRQFACSVSLLLTCTLGVFCLLLLVWSETILQVFYGDEYQGYGAVVCALSASWLAGLAGQGPEHGLRAIERPRANLHANVLGLAVTLPLALALIRPYGLLGAAWSMCAGRVATLVLRWIIFWRYTRAAAAELAEGQVAV
jgi:O-antigen/teichoic acid export membrane protein